MMEPDDTTNQLRKEVDEARDDFRRTASEIRHKFDVDQVRLESEVRRKPLRSMAIAGAVGFLFGSASRHTAVMLALSAGAVVGYSIATTGRATSSGREHARTAEPEAG